MSSVSADRSDKAGRRVQQKVRRRKPAKGNIGQKRTGFKVSIVTCESEFKAFHRLGPETRNVLNYALLPISAYHVLKWVKQRGWDPSDPRHDRATAQDLKDRMLRSTGVPYDIALCERCRKLARRHP
jgi:hypothetical protein